MKLAAPKINKNKAIKVGMEVVFVLIFLYSCYLLRNLYSTLHQDSYDLNHAAKSRTDLAGYQKATQRYEAGYQYQAPDESGVHNPFGVAPKSMDTTGAGGTAGQ